MHKKALIGLPLLALAATASAQSSVTVFGVLDTLVAFGRGSLSDKNQLTNGGNMTTRIGFRGVEDLGGGFAAGFVLEAGVVTDNGAGFATSAGNQPVTAGSPPISQGLTFNRRSTVSLLSPYGELRVGRDYVPSYSNMNVADSFGNAGVGTSISALLGVTSRATNGIRASNSIGYFLPDGLGGFYGNAMVAMGENARNQTGPAAATEDDGNYRGVRLGYRNSVLNVAVATGRMDFASGDMRSTNMGLAYTMGTVTGNFGYTKERIGAVDGKGVQIGVDIAVGAGQVRASYGDYQTRAGTNPKSSKIAVGYVYNLSKRTAVYTTYARVRNSGGATYALNGSTTAANSASSGLDIGLRHSF